MKLSHGASCEDEDVLEAARKIVRFLVSEGLTYEKATDTLDTAQDMLLTETKPTIEGEVCHKNIDKEQKLRKILGTTFRMTIGEISYSYQDGDCKFRGGVDLTPELLDDFKALLRKADLYEQGLF